MAHCNAHRRRLNLKSENTTATASARRALLLRGNRFLHPSFAGGVIYQSRLPAPVGVGVAPPRRGPGAIPPGASSGPPIAGLTQQDVDTFIAAGNHPAPITDRSGLCDDPGEFGVMTRKSRFDPADKPVPVMIAGQFPMCVAEYIRRDRAGEKVDHL